MIKSAIRNPQPPSAMPLSPLTDSLVENETNLRDYWCVLVRRRALILGLTCLAAITTAIFSLLQPNIYQSKATLMPLAKSSGGLYALGELGGLLPSGLGTAAKESPAGRMLAILSSRTLAEDVIQRLDLLPRLFAKKWDAAKQQWRTDKSPTLHDAVRVLGNIVSISDKKNGVLTITVEHSNPDLAATIANQYTDALQHILNDNAFSLAKKNRLFIEAQLQKTRRDLTAAEEALRQFEQEHQIIALEAQAEAAVKAFAMLQGEIMAKEVQLGVLQRSMTGSSREVTLLQEELQGLRAQLGRMQHGVAASRPAAGKNPQHTQAFPSFEQAPEIKLWYARLHREALIQNKLFTLLVQQLEQVKIEEARDETAFQVLDHAIPPDKRSKPKRSQSVLLSAIVGVFVGIFVAFVREYLGPTIRTREQVERQVGIPVLAEIPPAPSQKRRRRLAASPQTELVLHQPAGTPLVEAYRYLYARLQHRNGQRAPRTILLTSPEPDAAVATTAVSLGLAAAGLGVKTLLVDGNVYQPVLHRLVQTPLTPGLGDVLVHPEDWQKGVYTTAVDHLYLLPAGTVTPAARPAFHAAALDTLLAQCQSAYDFILLTAPPVLGLSDAALLGGKVEAVCLVLTCGLARLDATAEAKAALEAVQANVIGAILIGSAPRVL